VQKERRQHSVPQLASPGSRYVSKQKTIRDRREEEGVSKIPCSERSSLSKLLSRDLSGSHEPATHSTDPIPYPVVEHSEKQMRYHDRQLYIPRSNVQGLFTTAQKYVQIPFAAYKVINRQQQIK